MRGWSSWLGGFVESACAAAGCDLIARNAGTPVTKDAGAMPLPAAALDAGGADGPGAITDAARPTPNDNGAPQVRTTVLVASPPRTDLLLSDDRAVYGV